MLNQDQIQDVINEVVDRIVNQFGKDNGSATTGTGISTLKKDTSRPAAATLDQKTLNHHAGMHFFMLIATTCVSRLCWH